MLEDLAAGRGPQRRDGHHREEQRRRQQAERPARDVPPARTLRFRAVGHRCRSRRLVEQRLHAGGIRRSQDEFNLGLAAPTPSAHQSGPVVALRQDRPPVALALHVHGGQVHAAPAAMRHPGDRTRREDQPATAWTSCAAVPDRGRRKGGWQSSPCPGRLAAGLPPDPRLRDDSTSNSRHQDGQDQHQSRHALCLPFGCSFSRPCRVSSVPVPGGAQTRTQRAILVSVRAWGPRAAPTYGRSGRWAGDPGERPCLGATGGTYVRTQRAVGR